MKPPTPVPPNLFPKSASIATTQTLTVPPKSLGGAPSVTPLSPPLQTTIVPKTATAHLTPGTPKLPVPSLLPVTPSLSKKLSAPSLSPPLSTPVAPTGPISTPSAPAFKVPSREVKVEVVTLTLDDLIVKSSVKEAPVIRGPLPTFMEVYMSEMETGAIDFSPRSGFIRTQRWAKLIAEQLVERLAQEPGIRVNHRQLGDLAAARVHLEKALNHLNQTGWCMECVAKKPVDGIHGDATVLPK
jgi:hypothetical protein